MNNERQMERKKAFIKEQGYWNNVWDDLLQLDEEFFEVYSHFTSVPWKAGVLDPKIKELINVAISSSPTHLSAPATRIHIQNALRLGATRAEILEVLEIVCILGMHTCAVGIPLMVEEADAVDSTKSVQLTEKQEHLKAEFIEQMGYWTDFRQVLLHMDEYYFEAYFNFLTSPWKKGILEPKVIELIYMAIDSSTTHLYVKGIQVHLKNAKKYGATKAEILEVLQLTSSLGFNTLLMGIPILLEELEKTE